MKVFLTGSTGFVGRHMLERLVNEGHQVNALVRDARKQVVDNVQCFAGDVVEGTGLDRAMAGCEAVIHLVGIIVEKGRNTFERVHHLGTRNVVEAAKRNGVRRFIHMSALGVRENGVAPYQTTKWKGEEEVRNSGVPFCILRPSVIYGPGDGFVTQMVKTMQQSPWVRPVPGDGKPKFRPIFIDDVITCFARALTSREATGRAIDIGGPDELTLNAMLAEIARAAGVRKPAVHVPLPLMFAGAALLEKFLSGPPVTVDQLKMLREGSTCDIGPMRRIFGLEPKPLRPGLSSYLGMAKVNLATSGEHRV